MPFILSSVLGTHYYDKKGNKIPTVIGDKNGLLSTIKRYVKNAGRVVYVANDPTGGELNDEGIAPAFTGFKMSGLDFAQRIVLDDRNKERAEELLTGADLIVLGGGKIICQRDFFEEIGMRGILAKCRGLVIGVSAGAMNLCADVFNFPEDESDLGSPRWTKGLGFCDLVLVPHFDGFRKRYQIPCELEPVKSYILPGSFDRELVGLPNGSYVLVDDGVRICGKAYDIKKGKVRRRRI